MSTILLIYTLEFLFFSFGGWIIDSLFRSYKNNNIINAGYLGGLFCPIYGVGGLILILTFKFLQKLPVAEKIFIAGIFMVCLEYIGAYICEKVFRIKLWDYSQNKYNLHGRIDLEHSIYWFLMSVFFYFAFFSWIIKFEDIIKSIFYA